MDGDPSYSSADVCARTGATYRQLDYWTRVGLVAPSVSAGIGYGTRRRWSPADVAKVAEVAAVARRRAMPLADLIA